MKKESKNRGVRRACAGCKRAIVFDMNLTGTGDFSTTCHLCLRRNKVIIGAETHVTVELEPEFKGIKIGRTPLIGIINN